MWIDRCFQRELEEAGLSGFEAVMAHCGGHCWRVLRDRENWRLELTGRHRRPLTTDALCPAASRRPG